MDRPAFVPLRNDRLTLGIVVAATMLVLVGCAIRLWRIDLQPYWVDETWSIGVASLPLPDSLHTIKYEVHPPTYQLLLWAWIRIGGTGEDWTRLLSGLFGLLGVALSYWLLRRTPIPMLLRILIVVSSATSGIAIVYAQETRSYGAAWCAAVAITALTLRMAERPREIPSRGTLVAWAVAGALGSALHLFDTLLVVSAAIVIAFRWRSRFGLLGILSGVAVAPQVMWMMVGKIFVPGFAEASGWLPAPSLQDLGELTTTMFAVDGLHHTPRGFSWSSPAGIAAFAVLLSILLFAWGFTVRFRRQVPAGATDGTWFPASMLAQVAVVLTAGAWIISQVVHVWTVRNMIVAQPAVVWCAVSLAYVIAARLKVTQVAVAVLLLLLAVNLGWVVANMSQPYKPAHALPANVE